MPSGTGPGEMRREFHDQLAGIHSDVGQMLRLTRSALQRSTDAFLEDDVAAAEAVIFADAQVDVLYATVERDAFTIVATQAPVARDLRLVVGSLRIAQEAERCGDLISSIARRTNTIDASALNPQLRMLIHEMGAEGVRMLDGAAKAYDVLDSIMADEVVEWDAVMNAHHVSLLQLLFDFEDVDNRSLVELALVARFFERIGDHAAVVAQRVRLIDQGRTLAYKPNDTDSA